MKCSAVNKEGVTVHIDLDAGVICMNNTVSNISDSSVKKCYYCDQIFNDLDVIDHREHIIQNGIAGHLKTYKILCKACGNLLGRDVDKDFVKIFDNLNALLDVKKDRDPETKGYSAAGHIGNIEVINKGGVVTPVNPFYKIKGNNLFIYCSNRQIVNYKKKLSTKLEDPGLSKYSVTHINNIKGTIVYDFIIENETFIKGLSKISVGFAAYSGVTSDKLNCSLEPSMSKEGYQFSKKPKIIPYVPLNTYEKEFEVLKSKSGYYPIHNLVLFSTSFKSRSNFLVCYVELFSTFQFYVVLSDSYNGAPVYQNHIQKAVKQDSFKYEIGRDYYKMRKHELLYHDINDDMIKRRKEKESNKDDYEIEAELITESIEKKKYQIDFAAYLDAINTGLTNEFIIRALDGDFEERINFGFTISRLMYKQDDKDNDVILTESYKQLFLNDKLNPEYIFLNIAENIENPNFKDKFVDYGHEKFNNLAEYINKKSSLL